MSTALFILPRNASVSTLQQLLTCQIFGNKLCFARPLESVVKFCLGLGKICASRPAAKNLLKLKFALKVFSSLWLERDCPCGPDGLLATVRHSVFIQKLKTKQETIKRLKNTYLLSFVSFETPNGRHTDCSLHANSARNFVCDERGDFL